MNNFNKYVAQIFTPIWAVKKTLDSVGFDKNILELKIMEPSAGVGNFVYEIYSRIIKEAKKNKISSEETLKILIRNVHAIEIDQDNFDNLIRNVISIVKDDLGMDIRKADLINFKASDSLRWTGAEEFDVVVGNPPYTPVKFLPKKSIKYIEREFDFKTDIYMSFIEKWGRHISSDGVLAFILPTSFFDNEESSKELKLNKRIDFKENVFTAEIKTSIVLLKTI